MNQGVAERGCKHEIYGIFSDEFGDDGQAVVLFSKFSLPIDVKTILPNIHTFAYTQSRTS